MVQHEGTLTPTVVVDAKPWWQSITIWINILGIIVMILTGILELEFLASIPNLQAWILGILGVLNVILRVMKTVAPVTVLGKVVAPMRTENLKHYGGGPTTDY